MLVRFVFSEWNDTSFQAFLCAVLIVRISRFVLLIFAITMLFFIKICRKKRYRGPAMQQSDVSLIPMPKIDSP